MMTKLHSYKRLNISRRVFRRLMDPAIANGVLVEERPDVLKLQQCPKECIKHDFFSSNNSIIKTSCQKINIIDLLRRPLLHCALHIIFSVKAITHSDLSDLLRLDFYKARRLRLVLIEMPDIHMQINPDVNQDDLLYTLRKSNLSILNESNQQRSLRRKKFLLDYVQKHKTTFAHRLKMELSDFEHQAGLSIIVDRKTVFNLLTQLEAERKLTIMRSEMQENILVTVESEQQVKSTRDCEMISGTMEPFRCLGSLEGQIDDKCTSGMYGYVAKYQRCCILYKFIFYLLYSNDSDVQWAQHIKTRPIRKDMPSVIALGDLLLCMPLCIYTSLVRITKKCDELLEFISDERRYLLVHQLPISIKRLILQKRKFLFQIESIMRNLVMLGMAKIISSQYGSFEKQNMLFHLSKSLKFNHNLSFNLETLNDVDLMWKRFMTESLNDEKFKSCSRNKTNGTEPQSTLKGDAMFQEALSPVSTPPPITSPPGNMDGPLGVDKRMFTWMHSNWTIFSLTESAIKEHRDTKEKGFGPITPELSCRMMQFLPKRKRSPSSNDEIMEDKKSKLSITTESDSSKSEHNESAQVISTRQRKRLSNSQILWRDDCKRMLNILRASLLFLHVRLERFAVSSNSDRMSVNHLIGWLVNSLQINQIDPRLSKPTSNIRKVINNELTRDAASAICLQMELNNEMKQFRQHSQATFQNDTEQLLTSFYLKFKDKFNDYIIHGIPLSESKVDLRTMDMDDYRIVKRNPDNGLVSDFFIRDSREERKRIYDKRQDDYSETESQIRGVIVSLMLSTTEERLKQIEKAHELLNQFPEWLVKETLFSMHREHLIVKSKKGKLSNEPVSNLVSRIYELNSRFTKETRPISETLMKTMELFPDTVDGEIDAPWIPAAIIANMVHNIDLKKEDEN